MKTLHIEKVLESNPDISLFRFIKFSFENKVQDRLSNLNCNEQSIVNRCVDYKKKHNISFWDSYIRLGEDLDSRLFNHATFHNSNEKYIYIKRKEVLSFLEKSEECNLALNSNVIMKNGNNLHIPMFDFKILSKSNNLGAVRSVIKHFNLRGSILDSGKSYHFVGHDLVDEKSLIIMLSKFSLLHPIADRAWSCHQIMEHSASLRVSKKYGKYPNFIENIGY
ncbi:hypothetical protein AB6C85_22735 [Vibrio splendidus]